MATPTDTDPQQAPPTEELTATAHTRQKEIHDTAESDAGAIAIAAAAEEARDLEEKIQDLPEHQKLLAVLRITKPLQSKRLPEPYRAVSITVPRKNLGAMKALLQNLALPCSSDFAGDQSDELISLTYVVPHQSNIQHILDRASRSSIPAQIAIAEQATLILRKEGSPVISMHGSLNDHTSSIPTDQTPKAVSVDGEETTEITRQTGASSPTISPIAITTSGGHREDEALEVLEIAKFDTTHASAESYRHAKDSKISIPREGACTYLMIDQNLLQEQIGKSPRAKALLSELGLIARSPDFYITSYNGYLIVMALAERSGSLKGMAKRIFKAVPLAKMFVGKGEIQHHGPKNFTIEGFPQTDARQGMTALNEGIYIDPETTRHRDGSLDEVETKPTDNPRWLKMLSYRPKVSLRVGGPDKLVGYETQYEELVKGITDDQTKLMVVRGTAGMGKSRLIEEALSEDTVPSKIICSLDPSGKNIPGFGLMTIAEQISDQFTQYAETSSQTELLNHPSARALLNYISGSQKEKLEMAQRNPAKLEEDCFNVLQLLNTGKTPLVVDDVHHADRFSMQYITSLVERYLSQTDGKAILSMRPEEMYQPKAVESLITRTGVSSDVKQLSVGGLDFSRDFIAREFVFHSLPKEIRQTPAGTDRTLGPWYEELGRIAGRSPFVMKTLMDEILSDTENNLIIEGEAIVLKREVLERIQTIKSKSDLGSYYTERLERVPPNSRKFLQCLALMGGRATMRQVTAFSIQMLGVTDQTSLATITTPLTDGRYLSSPSKTKAGSEETTIQLQHETMAELIIGSLSPEEKLELSKSLYAIFREDRATHPDTKFALMHTVASSPVAPDVEDLVWGVGYGPLIDEALKDAKQRNAVGKAYAMAETILGENGCPTIIKAVADLQTPETNVPDAIKKIAIQTLFAKAESAVYIGRFDEVERSVAILEAIENAHPGSINMQEAYLLLFEKAYIQAEDDSKELERIYEEKLQNGRSLSPALKAVAEIKLAYRRNNIAEVALLYTEALPVLNALNVDHKRRQTTVPEAQRSPHPSYMEAFRLHHVRGPAENLRRSIRRKNRQIIDDDVLLQPGAIEKTHMPALLEITGKLREIEEARTANPLLFNGYSELSLRGEAATLAAVTGKYDQAVNILAESWRQAEQMDMHQRAARNAKLMGDIHVIQGISIIEKSPTASEDGKTSQRTTLVRSHLLKAIDVYSNEGMISLAQVDKDEFYQAAMRIQRLRAIGLLCNSYEGQLVVAKARDQLELETDSTRESLGSHIQKAFEDFIHVNRMWGNKTKTLSDFKGAFEVANEEFNEARGVFQQADKDGRPTTPAMREEFDKKSRAKEDAEAAYKKALYEVSEISYYLTSYIGDAIDMARTLSIDIPEEVLNAEASPFMTTPVIEMGESFAGRIFDKGIGELPRKRKGLGRAKNIAREAMAA